MNKWDRKSVRFKMLYEKIMSHFLKSPEIYLSPFINFTTVLFITVTSLDYMSH